MTTEQILRYRLEYIAALDAEPIDYDTLERLWALAGLHADLEDVLDAVNRRRNREDERRG